MKKISDLRESLGRQPATEQTEMKSLRTRSAAGRMRDQQTAQTPALQAKVRQLSWAPDKNDRMLALDQDFLSHDREIRDPIASDLLIAEIFDERQNGKTVKRFGRLFYSKERSLACHGSELDSQDGLKHTVVSNSRLGGVATTSRTEPLGPW